MDAAEIKNEEQVQTSFWTKGVRFIVVGAILALAIVACLMNFFNPLDIGPYGLLGFFVAAYATIAAILILAVKGVIFLWGQELNQRHVYSVAIAAFAPIMLLALSTLGQLRITDFVLVLLFEAIAIFYIFRRF